MQLRVVMRGLDPRIHVIAGAAGARRKDADGRNKSGHDDFWLVPVKTQHPVAGPRTALRCRVNDEKQEQTFEILGLISGQALRP